MGWNKRQRRWAKKYKGKVWFVSPRQLGTEPTKEASRQAANDWWEKKQAEVDESLGVAKKHPAPIIAEYRYALENHRRYAKWQRKYGSSEDAEKSEGCMEWLQAALKTDHPPFPLTKWQEDPLWEAKLDPVAWHVWLERMTQIIRDEKAEKATPPENTIKAHVDDYLTFRKALVASGKNKLGSYDTFRTRLNAFRQWLDPFAPIGNLNETLWERFYVHLSQQVAAGKMGGATMAGTLGAARAFVKNRWERRFIELPRNLNSRTLSASAPLKEIIVFTKVEITHLLQAASERKRLYLLLMLNCGFYPVDIAALKHDEVNWAAGRIVRQRTKTRGRSLNVPKVDYLLWRETFTLLKRYRSDHPDLVLVNSNGTPLWVEAEKDGKFNRNNNIRTAYFQLQTKAKIPKDQRKPLKSMRKTSASMLEEHESYGRYAEYFLGEAPSSVASRHYVRPSKEQFDAAVRWLGQQYGIK
jgi:hypothetical protein